MPDEGGGNHRYPPPGKLHPPAEVDFLHVREKAVVEAAQRLPHAAPDHQAGPRGPENIHGLVVLPRIALDLAQDAAAAERITETVDHAARRTGVFEQVALVPGMELGSAGAAVRMAVHPFHERPEPVRGDFDIGVDEHVILGLHLRQSAVVTACKAVIPVEEKGPDRRETRGEQRTRAVRGGIVRDDDFRVHPFGGGKQPREELREKVLRVPVQDDDGGFHGLCVVVVAAAAFVAFAVAAALAVLMAFAMLMAFAVAAAFAVPMTLAVMATAFALFMVVLVAMAVPMMAASLLRRKVFAVKAFRQFLLRPRIRRSRRKRLMISR